MSVENVSEIAFARFACPVDKCKAFVGFPVSLKEHVLSHFQGGCCPLCDEAVKDLAHAETHCAARPDHMRLAVFFDAYRSSHHDEFNFILDRCGFRAEFLRADALREELRKTFWRDVERGDTPTQENHFILVWTADNMPTVLSHEEATKTTFRYWTPITAPCACAKKEKQ
jgi:hypothetical protein